MQKKVLPELITDVPVLTRPSLSCKAGSTESNTPNSARSANLASIRANLKGLIFKPEEISTSENQSTPSPLDSAKTQESNACSKGSLDDKLSNAPELASTTSLNIPEIVTFNRKLVDRVTAKSKTISYFGMQQKEQEEMREIEASVFEIHGNFKELYDEFEILGQGASAIVRRCICKKTNQEYAVKIVNTCGDEELEYMIRKEFKNRMKINHKNVVNVHQLFIDQVKKKMYVVMEFIKGKEMLEVISENSLYTEKEASRIFKQLLHAIQYLHSHGVVHRDLKPHNILLTADYTNLKLTDFNVSKFTENEEWQYTAMSKENIKMWTYTGTVQYLAPEVFEDLEYTEAVDMWGAGLVLYMMLSGNHPFQSDNSDELIKEITKAKIEFKEDIWSSISDEAKDLIMNLLEKDYKKRFSPFQAMSHPWIVNNGGNVSSKKALDTGKIRENYRVNRKKEISKFATSEILQKKKLEKDFVLAYRSKFICKSPGEKDYLVLKI